MDRVNSQRWKVGGAAVAAGLVAAVLAGPVGATGATWFVAPTGNDSASCADAVHPCLTIDGAIAKAAAGDTISVGAGTYTGAGDEVVLVDKSVNLAGTNAVVDGEGVRRGIHVSPGVTTAVSGFDVERGALPNPHVFGGGGILNQGTLSLDESTVSGASAGGGIFTTGALTVSNSTISNNQASVSNEGGGIGISGVTSGPTVAIVNTTIADNSHTGDGGGIETSVVSPGSGALDLSNVTITGNTSGGGGSGVYVNYGWQLRLHDSIVSDVFAATSGSVTSAGYNLGTGFPTTTGDLVASGADLRPLADNGGPTKTVALGPASTAIDAGDPAGCTDASGAVLTSDQRGEPRPHGARCDIGAYEAGAAPAPSNDDFANAQPVSGAQGSISSDNIGATVETGEPEHAGDEGGASVWFAWTPGVNETAVLDTQGSSFDTLLAVYTGSSVDALTLLASNDDFNAFTTLSRACVAVTAGTTYYVAVDGWGGDTGTLTLDWSHKSDAQPCPGTPPQVSGTAHVGAVLGATPGGWVDAGTPSYQWVRCQGERCANIAGATGSAYTVTSRDVGTGVRVDVQEGASAPLTNSSAPTQAVSTNPVSHSANGRLYWATNRDSLSHYEIYSMLADGTSLQRLTDTAHFSTEPAASPDGTRIAFIQDGNLALMSPDGSGVLRTTIGAGFPVWSPDGSRIAFAHAAGGQFDGIDIVGNDVDQTPEFTLLSDTLGSFYDLAWSPDGATIAFTYKDGGDFDIATIAADGRGGYTNLTAASTADEHSPAWSPDGTKLLFVRGPIFGSITDGDLYVMDADGSNQQRLVDGDQQHVVTSAVWSPDGTKILFSENDNGNSELYTIPAAGGAKTPVVSHLDRDELATWAAPATFPLTVSRAGSGSGTVTCTGGCAASYPDATTVTLTATPTGGSTFDGWSGACSGTGTCTVTMLAARSVTASFGTPAPPAPPAPPSGGRGGGGGGGDGGSSGIPPDIHVEVTSSATGSALAVGADLLWFVTVSSRNVGGSSDVRLDLTLPAGWTYDRSYADRGPGCFGTPPNLTCDVGFINQSTSTHVTLWGKVAQAGELSFTAAAASQLEPEFDPKDNSMTLVLFRPALTPPPPAPAPVPAPIPVAPPALTGSPLPGSTLHTPAKAGAKYQWQLCTANGCIAIKGATKPALKLAKTYAGKSIRVVVTQNGKTTVSKKVAIKVRAAWR